MKIYKFLLVVLSIIIPLAHSDSHLIEFETTTLKNGLVVVVIPNHTAPVVYHSLWYKIGSADSPYERTGIAHFIEHLMFKGSKKFPKDTYQRMINQFGGEQNANTSFDRTCYYVTTAKEYLPKIMELEADRMTNLMFSDEDFAKEKNVVLQERRQRTDALPEGRLIEAANAAFFWHHPYGKPVIGFQSHIEKYTKQDVLDFYNNWYAPNNAILVLSGDITLSEAMPLLKKYYEPIAKKILHIRKRSEEPNHSNIAMKVSIRDPQLKSMWFEAIYPAPNHKTAKFKEVLALDLVSSILGDQSYGRLYKALVEQQKIAHTVDVKYIGDLLDPYYFSIYITPVNSMDFTMVEAAMIAEIKRFLAEGVTAKELAKAKKEMLLQYRFGRDSLKSLANLVGESLAHEYSMEEIKNWQKDIEDINKDEINAMAKKVLTNAARVTAYSYPIMEN